MTKMVLFVVVTVLSVGWSGLCLYRHIDFGIDVTGHLKRAADANTVPLAISELSVALQNLHERGIRDGYTSVLYRTPDEDVGFWTANLNGSLAELRSLPATTSTLEKSNALIKLRETLLDHGAQGVEVTAPSGISLFPANTAYALSGTSLFLLWCMSAIFAFKDY